MKICVIFHNQDLDGWMSAAIVKHWFIENNKPNNYIINGTEAARGGNPYNPNSIDFIGYNYGQPTPDLSEYDKVIMCDISFPKEEMIKLWDKLGVENMIWIDHHVSAIKDIQDTKWLWEGAQDTKFAACELTWQYFFPNEEMPEIVRLLGLYDSFRHKGTDEETKVLEFQYGARQCISNYEDAYHYLSRQLSGYKNDDMFFIEESGAAIYKYLCTEAKQNYKNGFEIRLPGLSPNYTKTYKEKKKKKLIEVSNDKSSCTLYIYNDDVTSGYIANVFVNEEHRRKGIGTALMLEVEKIANKEGVKDLYVKVFPDSNTYRFYHSLDYRIFDEKDNEKWFTKGIGIDTSYKFLCINRERFNPINFGIDYHKDGYDGCACFHYANGMWNFSIYNDNGLVDCSIIAKQYGGGGHFSASGFRCDSNTFLKIINNG